METKEWIENVRRKISEEEDVTLFNEAVGCLSNGYFRAGYVISWIAIVESLKKKIYDSYNLGDKQAENSYHKITESELKKLSVDKIILDEAKQLKLIEEHEVGKLEFLWEQRNLFAHPYSKEPSEVDLKFIIVSAVDICLSKPLLYRKNYIDELIKNLVSMPYFLTDDQEKTKAFARRIILRVPVDLHPYFFKTFLFNLSPILIDDKKFKIQIRIRQFLIELFRITTGNLEAPEWSLEHRATNFPYSCLLGFVSPLVWEKLPERIKELLIEYSVTETDEDKQIMIRQIIGLLWKNDKLEGIYKKKFILKLNTVDFSSSYRFYHDKISLYNRIISEFNSNKYLKQNSVVEFLRDAEGQSYLSSIDQSKQITIGMKIAQSASSKSWTAKSYLSSLEESKETTTNVIKGILVGSLMPSEKSISINKELLFSSLKIINRLIDNDSNDVFNYVIQYLNELDQSIKFYESEKSHLEFASHPFNKTLSENLEKLRIALYSREQGIASQ